MEPTVGRIVLFTPSEFSTEPLPAMIVRVHSSICVNLKVFTDGPTDKWETSVVLGEGARTWAWPARK